MVFVVTLYYVKCTTHQTQFPFSSFELQQQQQNSRLIWFMWLYFAKRFPRHFERAIKVYPICICRLVKITCNLMRQLTRINWLLYWRPRHMLTILIDRKESAVAWLDLFMQIFGIFTHRVTICININCYLSVFMVERKITSDRFV